MSSKGLLCNETKRQLRALVNFARPTENTVKRSFSTALFYCVLFSSLCFLCCFQALLEVLQQDQPELAEAASTMTQQQRHNWLLNISDRISSLDPGIARFTILSLCLRWSCYELTSFPGSLLFTSQGAPWNVKRRDPGNEVGYEPFAL